VLPVVRARVRRAASLGLARRSPLGLVALAVLGVCVLHSGPGAVARTAANIADLARHAGESFDEARVRVFGEAYVAGIAELRRRIPEDAAYLLVDAAGGTDGVNRVRHDLAPRKPILLGTMTGWRREFPPGRPPGAPGSVVIARKSGPPDFVSTDAFLGSEIVDPGREDVSIPASIDTPTDGARVARSLTLSGWCQERGGRPCASVLVLVDGAPLHAGVERFPRLDVAAAVEGIGDCRTAGWRAAVAFEESEAGEHTVVVFFRTADGRYRRLGPARFTVTP
jgi:hypothetical protein